MRISVVLPAPFSPSTACTVPGATDSRAPASAVVPPNRLTIPASSKSGSTGLSVTASLESGRGVYESHLDAEFSGEMVGERPHPQRRSRGVHGIDNGQPLVAC